MREKKTEDRRSKSKRTKKQMKFGGLNSSEKFAIFDEETDIIIGQ